MELAGNPRYLLVQSLHAPGTTTYLLTRTPVFFGLIDKWLRKLTHHNRHQGPKPWQCDTLRTTNSLSNQGNSFQGTEIYITCHSNSSFKANFLSFQKFQVRYPTPPSPPRLGILAQPSGPKQAAQPARAWLSGDVRLQGGLEMDLTNYDDLC